ncbi:MAG: PAS domain S-box protein [Oscillochloridaceae bacterium umkhey_bin13]
MQPSDPQIALLEQRIAALEAELAAARRADAQPNEHQYLLEALVANAVDVIFAANFDGTLRYVNPAFERLLGYGSASLNQPTWSYIVEGQDTVNLKTAIDHVIQHGSWIGRLNYRCADGRTFPGLLSSFLIHDQDGQPIARGGFIRDLTEQDRQEQALKAQRELYDSLLSNLPGVAYRCRNDSDWTVEFISNGTVSLYGCPPEDFRAVDGPPKYGLVVFILEEERDWIWETVQAALESRRVFQLSYRIRDLSGQLKWVFEQGNGVYDAEGNLIFIDGFVTDITAQHQAEEERNALQNQVIAAQAAALRELSTPLMPIADGVVALPLIGSIDSARAQQIVETLLTGVVERRAATVILDITGVPVVDTQVANVLLQATQATKLLGARVVLTGIRPEVAQTLVGLGIDLSGIITLASLQHGIAWALRR